MTESIKVLLFIAAGLAIPCVPVIMLFSMDWKSAKPTNIERTHKSTGDPFMDCMDTFGTIKACLKYGGHTK